MGGSVDGRWTGKSDLFMRESTSEDALNGGHLFVGRLGESHLVELRACGVCDLCPVEAPVSIEVAGPVFQVVSLAVGAGDKVTHGLVADEADVPLSSNVITSARVREGNQTVGEKSD